jgi:hypothetical protein
VYSLKLHLVAATLTGRRLSWLAALSPRIAQTHRRCEAGPACLVAAALLKRIHKSKTIHRTSNNANRQTNIHTYIHTYTI